MGRAAQCGSGMWLVSRHKLESVIQPAVDTRAAVIATGLAWGKDVIVRFEDRFVST